jgi:hypothetical protein
VGQSKAGTIEKLNKIRGFNEISGGVRHRFLNFKTGALNYSATLPSRRIKQLAVTTSRTKHEQSCFWPQLGPKA